MINSKNLDKFIPYEHFKMEGLNCLKFLLEQEDLLCKIDLKEAHFSVPINKNSQKFVRFQWSDSLYEFLCLCFGLGTAPIIFTKLLKVPIALLRRQHWNHYLPRRYVANGKDVTRNSRGKRQIDFYVATFEFCYHPQKISPAHWETNGVSGLGNRTRKNDFCSFIEKIKTCVSTISGDFQATKNFSLKSRRFKWPLVITCPSHFTSLNPVSISSTRANISSTEKRVLQWSCHTGKNLAREELLWWMENVKL